MLAIWLYYTQNSPAHKNPFSVLIPLFNYIYFVYILNVFCFYYNTVILEHFFSCLEKAGISKGIDIFWNFFIQIDSWNEHLDVSSL